MGRREHGEDVIGSGDAHRAGGDRGIREGHGRRHGGLADIGEAHIDQAAADRLPRLEILGRSSHYLNKSGVSKGVLVTYTPLDGETMFVKLTGPKDVVKTQVGQFEAFCRSLR